jgi:hypothetical protein
VRSQAAARLLAFANSYKQISNERQIPLHWSQQENTVFPLPIRRAVAELLLVFKRKAIDWGGELPVAVQVFIFDKLAAAWLHPPEPPIEFFCLLLLLDVVKAPAARRNSLGGDGGYGGYTVPTNAKSTDSKLTIETFFNRMLVMTTANQKRVFSYFMDLHEHQLAQAAADGDDSASSGITDVGAGSQRATLLGEPRLICHEPVRPLIGRGVGSRTSSYRPDIGRVCFTICDTPRPRALGFSHLPVWHLVDFSAG